MKMICEKAGECKDECYHKNEHEVKGNEDCGKCKIETGVLGSICIPVKENKMEQKLEEYHEKKHDKNKVRYDLIEWDILEKIDFSDRDGSDLSDLYKNLKTETVEFLEGCVILAVVSLGGYDNFLYELARVYTYGADKYGDLSWKTVPNGKQRYVAALHRHMRDFRRGDFVNYQDGMLYHVAQVAGNAISVLWFIRNEEEK